MGLIVAISCSDTFAQDSAADAGEFAVETIDDVAEVTMMKARGKPVDLLTAMLAEMSGDYRYDLDYDDFDRFVLHEPERSRTLLEKRLSDASLRVDARIDAAQALATIGDPRGVEYLMSRDETTDPHELTLVLRAMNEIGPVTRQKAILAASALSWSFPTNPMLTDELIAELASIIKSKEVLSLIASRFARVAPGSLPSAKLAGALVRVLGARDPELCEAAQAIRNRFVHSLDRNFTAIEDDFSYTNLLFDHVDPGDRLLLRDAMLYFAETLHDDECLEALVSIDSSVDLIDWATDRDLLEAVAKGLLRANYDIEPALARFRGAVADFEDDDWASWVLLASRGTRDDRAAAKAALERGALAGEAAFRLAAELRAISTDEALAGLVELGLVRSEDVTMADLVLDEDHLEVAKIESLLCDGPRACLLPVLVEGDQYVVSVIHRLAGISSGKLRFESANVTTKRDEDAGTGERTIELVANGVGYRVVTTIEDLDDDDFEPDIAPLIALCNRILETIGIEERIQLVPFEDTVILFATPNAVATAQDRGYLPK